MANLHYYRHRPFKSRGWLWWVALVLCATGLIVFYTLPSSPANDTTVLRRMVLIGSISIACILGVVASSDRWFYN